MRSRRVSWERSALIAVLLLAAVLRLTWIADGWFGVDQARDIAWAYAIASAESFPLVGPLMRGRVHLGAIYYYVWSLPALCSAAVLAPYVFAALLGVAAVWMTYRLGRGLAGPRVGQAAALLLATTPIAVIDARVAWAPAALPPLAAAFLLAGSRFLKRSTPLGAMLVMALPAFATQLHLAAAPLVPIGAVVVLMRGRQVGRRGVTLAVLAALVPVVPMAFAYYLDSVTPAHLRGDTGHLATQAAGSVLSPGPMGSPPGQPVPPVARDVKAGRLMNMLAVSGRVLDALNPPVGERPLLANVWIALERAWMPIVLLAAIAGVGWAATSSEPARASFGFTAATLLVCVLVVAAMPVEAWYYYLDTTLVPAAVVLAVMLRPDRSRLAALGIAGLSVLRTIGLVWWIGANHGNGFVWANLDPLRLGGSSPEASVGRSRLLTVRVKEQAAAALVGDFGIPIGDLWRRTHGAGFADLDNDNGFFFRRADAHGLQRTAAIDAAADEALVVYASTFPDSWVQGFAAPRRVGPLAIYRYTPTLRITAATIESCGDAPVPTRPIPDPRDYFFGEPPYPEWPCRAAVVRVAVDPPPAHDTVRVFARGLGAGHVVSISSEPAGADVEADPSAGRGLLLPPGPSVLRVTLTVDGPAALDLYEIRGERGNGPGRR